MTVANRKVMVMLHFASGMRCLSTVDEDMPEVIQRNGLDGAAVETTKPPLSTFLRSTKQDRPSNHGQFFTVYDEVTDIPPDDIFRWKCLAIIESMAEGATLQEAKDALFTWVYERVEGVPWDSPQAHQKNTLRMKRYFAWAEQVGYHKKGGKV